MDIRTMHYVFKQRLNKVDSQQVRNLKVPEIDIRLNEAQNLLIKTLTQPRYSKDPMFEFNQRTIDDFRDIVVDQSVSGATALPLTSFTDSSYVATLPSNYLFYISSDVIVNRGDCKNIRLRGIQIAHNDRDENSPFNRSSFGWREANIRFLNNQVRVFTSGEYIPTFIAMSYLRQPLYMQNAQDAVGGEYYLADGTTLLTGFQNCELTQELHDEIVDMAVLIATGDLNPNYQIGMNKTKLTS